jgi:hypothetical protein
MILRGRLAGGFTLKTDSGNPTDACIASTRLYRPGMSKTRIAVCQTALQTAFLENS